MFRVIAVRSASWLTTQSRGRLCKELDGQLEADGEAEKETIRKPLASRLSAGATYDV